MRKLISALMCLCCFAYSYAQVNVMVVAPSQVGACFDNLFQVNLAQSSGFTGTFEVAIANSLGAGTNPTCQGNADQDPFFLSVLPGSLSPNCTIQSEIYSNDTLKLVFSFTGVIPNFGFNLKVNIDCSIIDGNGGNNTIIYQQTYSNSNGNSFNVNTSGTNQYSYSGVTYPFLSYNNLVSATAVFGQTLDLTYFYQFTPADTTSNIQINFTFNNLNCPSSFQTNSIMYSLDGSALAPLLTWHDVQLNDAGIHTIYITQNITITGCLPCANNTANFAYRCSPASTNPDCQSCQNDFNTNVTVLLGPGSPEVTGSRVWPLNTVNGGIIGAAANNYRYWNQSCPGDTTNWVYRFENTGNFMVDTHEITLTNNYINARMLTSIDLNSISVQLIDNPPLNGNTQIWDTTIAHIDTLNLCTETSPLRSYRMIVNNFDTNDVILFGFRTTKCCSENDSLLLNQGKYFNEWVVSSRHWNPCGSFIADRDSNNLPIRVTPGYTISGNGYNGAPNINQTLQFFPSVTDMAVPAGPSPQFGDSAEMFIDLTGLFSDFYSHELLGAIDGDISLSSLLANQRISGILRARITCTNGLRIQNMPNDVALVNRLTQDTLNFDCFHTSVNDTDCIGGEYFYYFPISNGADLVNFMHLGRFHFMLQACCMSSEPAKYDVAFHLLMNTDSCNHNFTCNGNVNPPDCADCCWLPLSSKGGNISVHCPGCLAPGIIVDNYKLYRTTLGYADSDNNGVADVPLTQLTKTHPDYPNMQTNASFHGDTIEDCMTSHFQQGDPILGYNYVQMSNFYTQNVLHYLQLERTMQHKNLMGITPIGFDFYIDVPDTSSPNCIECTDCGGGNAGFETIFSMSVSGTNLLNFIDTSFTDKFFFTFHDSVIQALSGGTFFRYEENQRYRLVTRYKLCGNYDNPSTFDPIDCNIRNNMWMSSIKRNHNAFSNIPGKPDLHITYFTSQFADSFIFYCETFGGLHYFYYQTPTFLIRNWPGLDGNGATSTCHPIIRYKSRINGVLNNPFIFPFEIRNPSIQPVSWTITPPPHYRIDSARAFTRFNMFTGFTHYQLPSAYVSFSNLNYPILGPTAISIQNNLPSLLTCVQDSSAASGTGSTLAFSDNKLDLVFEFFTSILPDSCSPGAEFNAFTNLDSALFIDADTVCGQIYDSIPCKAYAKQEKLLDAQYPNSRLIQPDANMSLSFLQDTLTANTSTLCWSFQLTNAGGLTPAYNPFIQVPSLPYLSNWSVTIDTITSTVSSTNGIILLPLALSRLLVNSVVNGILCAEYDSCIVDTAIIPLNIGWSCRDSGNTPCEVFSDSIYFYNSPVQLNFAGDSQNTNYSLCDSIVVSSAFFCEAVTLYGELFPELVAIGTLPLGLQVGSVILQNCSTGVSVQLSGSYPDWIISRQNIYDIGYTDSSLVDNDCINILVSYMPNCNYNGWIPDLTVSGVNYCGDNFATVSNSHLPPWTVSDSSCCINCDEMSISLKAEGKCEVEVTVALPNNTPCDSIYLIYDNGNGNLFGSVNYSEILTYNQTGNYTICVIMYCYLDEEMIDSCIVCSTINVDCGLDTLCLKILNTGGGDVGADIIKTADNGYAITGTLTEDGNNNDAYVLKYSQSLQEEVYIRISDDLDLFTEEFYSIAENNDYLYACGRIRTDGANHSDIYLTCIHKPSNTTMWIKRYKTDYNEVAVKVFVETSTSSLIIFGYTSAPTQGANHDIFALKTNLNGNILNYNTYRVSGKSYSEFASDAIKLNGKDEYLIVGRLEVTNTNSDILAIRIHSNLSPATSFANYGTINIERAFGVTQSGRRAYIVGTTDNANISTGNQDIFVVDIDTASLAINATKTYGIDAISNETGYKIKQTCDNDFVIVGEVNGHSHVLNKTDGLILKIKNSPLTTSHLNALWAARTNEKNDHAFYNLAKGEEGYINAVGKFAINNSDDELLLVTLNCEKGESCCLIDEKLITNKGGKSGSTKVAEKKGNPFKIDSLFNELTYYKSELICPVIKENKKINNKIEDVEVDVTVVPNPNNGLFIVQINNPTVAINRINIFELSSKLVHSSINPSLDVSFLSNGFYLLEVITPNKKFVVKFSKISN